MCEFIDKIFYINLEKRTDRKEQIEKELNTFDLKFERFSAIETPTFGILGCGLSHLKVLKIAKERNYKNVLILEDDFTFLVSKEELQCQLSNFFNLQLDYDVCFLSYNLIGLQIKLDNGVVNKGIDVQTASGYLVNQHYYDALINLYEDAMPLLEKTLCHWIYCNDQVWKTLQKKDNWFFFIKRIGMQQDRYSDNAQSFIIKDHLY